MELDDFKSTWDQQLDSGINTPLTKPDITLAKGPLDKIRRNMKNELYAQLAAVVLMGLFPFVFHFSAMLFTPFYILYAVLIAIATYFMFRFYLFYRRLSGANMNSQEHLHALYYDIRLNMEMYQSFSYSLVPFILIFIGMIAYNTRRSASVAFTPDVLYMVIAAYVVIMVLMAWATHAWVHLFYGKYAREIKKLIDQLTAE